MNGTEKLTSAELEELFPETLDLLPETDPSWPAKIRRMIDIAIDAWRDHGANREGISKTCYQILALDGASREIALNWMPMFAELQRRHEKITAFILAHNRDAANKAYMDHQANIIDGILDGTHSKYDGWAFKDFEEDFAERQRAGDKLLLRIYAKFIPYARAVAEKFAALANGKADELDATEKERYENFGVDYPGPSPLSVAFRNCAQMALHRVKPEEHSASPRTVMPYLPI